MADLVQALVQGFPIGCVYALIALGFVLTYKTSGIFNLAFGAQAFTSAAVYYELAVRREWNIALALLVAVGLVAPAIGLVLDRALFRHLRNAPPVARLVSSLGLLIAIPSIVKILMDFDREPTFGAIGIVPDGGTIYGQGHIYAVTRDEVATIAVTFLAAAFLMVLFRYTALGLRMRAVVESPRMTELAGVNADRVSAFAWALSSLFAGLSGVLLAPRFANVNETNFFELVVVAIAAAAFAGLTSLPRALLGGLLLGVAQQVLAIFLPTNSLLAQGLRPSLPFVVLFLVIVLWRGLRKAGAITDPLAGVNPPPPGRATDIRGPGLTIATYVFGIVAAVAFWNFYVAGDAFWLLVTTEWIIYSVIFLSITVITGMAGQISLAQATFAAIGAFTTMQVTDRFGASVLLSMVIGAVVAAAVGGLLSLPVLRLGGIWLALATLAFALFFNAVLVKFDWIGGGIPQPRVPRPVIGPFDFASDKSFLVLCIVILAIVAFLVLQVREGTTGKFLSALRGSEVAAESVGIDPARARITAFALSAGIAGLGGGLLAIRQGAVNYEQNYTVFVGLFWVVIVVTLGTRVIDGAIQAGFGFKVFPELVLKSWLGLSQAWHFVLFGFGAITFARHPEGVLEFNKRKSLNFFQRQLDKLMGREVVVDDQVVDYGREPLVKTPRAGFWARFIAYQIDAVVVLALWVGIGSLVLAWFPPSWEENTAATGFAIVAVLVAVFVLYWGVLEGLTGHAVGKRALGLRVVDQDTGRPIGVARGIGRTVFRNTISSFLFYLGFIAMLWDRNNQTWHDTVALSLVIRERQQGRGPQRDTPLTSEVSVDVGPQAVSASGKRQS